MIRIREARANDYDTLAEIWHQGSVLPEAGVFEAPPELLAELRARLPREVRENEWSVFAAEDAGGEVVGLLAFDAKDNCLRELFLASDRRSQGIGKVMLDRAKLEMPNGFWLRTRIENGRAQRFYEREGLLATHDAPHPLHPEATFRHYCWR